MRGKPLPRLLNDVEAEVGLNGARMCRQALLLKELNICGPYEEALLPKEWQHDFPFDSSLKDQ